MSAEQMVRERRPFIATGDTTNEPMRIDIGERLKGNDVSSVNLCQLGESRRLRSTSTVSVLLSLALWATVSIKEILGVCWPCVLARDTADGPRLSSVDVLADRHNSALVYF
jgi:hypothetical protein